MSSVRVVVTGAPCTGKTTLARQLAERFAAPLSIEYARLYQDQKPTLLDASDVEPIARGQVAVEDTALAGARGLVLHDTDLVSTVVYSRHYYGVCPAWIEEAAVQRRANLYLLLFPDVPWIDDGLQRGAPQEREILHARFDAALRACAARVVPIRGDWDARMRTAHQAVEDAARPAVLLD